MPLNVLQCQDEEHIVHINSIDPLGIHIKTDHINIIHINITEQTTIMEITCSSQLTYATYFKTQTDHTLVNTLTALTKLRLAAMQGYKGLVNDPRVVLNKSLPSRGKGA